jgi:ABC-2 type transport system ATP-binding protein
LQQLESAGVTVENVELRRPTLDDVFLTLTGHGAEQARGSKNKKKRSKK